MKDNKKFLSFFPSPSCKQTRHRHTEGIMQEKPNNLGSSSILLNLTSLLTDIHKKLIFFLKRVFFVSIIYFADINLQS